MIHSVHLKPVFILGLNNLDYFSSITILSSHIRQNLSVFLLKNKLQAVFLELFIFDKSAKFDVLTTVNYNQIFKVDLAVNKVCDFCFKSAEIFNEIFILRIIPE